MKLNKKFLIDGMFIFGFVVLICFLAAIIPLNFSYANEHRKVKAPNTNEIQVVNFNPVWGDVDANTDKICNLSSKACTNGAKMVVFPAMSLSGYMSESDSELAKKTAVSIDDTHISQIAKSSVELNSWIIFGAIEIKNDLLYNSTFAVSPEGKASVYEEITPENSLFTPGDYPVVINTEWGYVGLTAGNDILDSPEVCRYYAVTNASEKTTAKPLYTCKMIIGCLAFNEGYDSNSDDYTATEWTLLNRIICRGGTDYTTCVVSNICGNQNGNYFPGGSHIFSYTKEDDDEIEWIYAGGEPRGDNFKLYMGKGESDKIYPFKLHKDYDLWSDIYNNLVYVDPVCDLSASFNPKLYEGLYKELADEQNDGIIYDHKVDYDTNIKVATANTACPRWGHKKEGIENVEALINDAKGANIVLFPETSLEGYTYEEGNYDWEDYNPITKETRHTDNKTEMHVALAEKVPGPTTQYLYEKYAKPLNMYIVLGMSQIPDEGYIVEGGVNKVYNSLVVISPDGQFKSYPKVHATNDESKWSANGNKPLIMDLKINGQTVKTGFSICRDAQFYPEMYRYYAMKGADLLIHISASMESRFVRECRMVSYCGRDNISTIVCNTLGNDGPPTKTVLFNKTSLISSPRYLGYTQGTSSEYDFLGRPVEMYGTNTLAISPKGIETGTTFEKNKGLNIKGCGFTTGSIRYETFAKIYDEISYKILDNYTPLYNDTISRNSLSEGIDVRPEFSTCGLKFENKVFEYDGQPHSIYIDGQIPKGATVEYVGNNQVSVGEYKIQANIIGANQYKNVEPLYANMSIVDAANNDSSASPSTGDDNFYLIILLSLIFASSFSLACLRYKKWQ